MNHFFSLALSEEARQQAAKVAEAWASQLLPEQKAKWTAPEDYHLTLHFLGDLPEEAEADLIAAAIPVAAATKPFELQLAESGTFPQSRSPRVLWLGIRPCRPLQDLVLRLRDALETLGYPPEKRPLRPHITLARCRTGHGEEAWTLPGEQAFLKWTVARFALLQTLSPESSANDVKGRYNSVHTFPFGGKLS
jgi:2'-5' RNA ligase